METTGPLVSIGMPLYNAARYLRLALEALLRQDYPHFELLIADNASTDETGEICREYATRDTRIQYYRNPLTVDVLANYNGVMGLARGRYFMWAANDDLWEPEYVGALVGALEARPDAVLAFSRYDLIDAEGHPAGTFRTNWSEIFAGPRSWQFAQLALREEATHKATHIYGLMRRNVLQSIGGMATSRLGFAGEDVVTLLRLLGRGHFVVVNRPLFHYRVRPPISRETEPLLAYAWKRVAMDTMEHRGNLLLLLQRNHVYHANLRSVIREEAPLSPQVRLALWLALLIREFWVPLTLVPPAAARELGLLGLRPPARPKTV